MVSHCCPTPHTPFTNHTRSVIKVAKGTRGREEWGVAVQLPSYAAPSQRRLRRECLQCYSSAKPRSSSAPWCRRWRWCWRWCWCWLCRYCCSVHRNCHLHPMSCWSRADHTHGRCQGPSHLQLHRPGLPHRTRHHGPRGPNDPSWGDGGHVDPTRPTHARRGHANPPGHATRDGGPGPTHRPNHCAGQGGRGLAPGCISWGALVHTLHWAGHRHRGWRHGTSALDHPRLLNLR
jgi:hypothetical protein